MTRNARIPKPRKSGRAKEERWERQKGNSARLDASPLKIGRVLNY